MSFKKFVLIFFVFIMTISFVNSINVEVFSNYNTKVSFINTTTINVVKEISLKNVNSVAIVPGELELRINSNGENIKLDENSIKVFSSSGKLSYRLINSTNGYVLYVKLFTPLSPGAEYKLKVSYNLNIRLKGFLFHNMIISIKDNGPIPIEKGKFYLKLPENYKFTYLSLMGNNTKIISNNQIEINILKKTPNQLQFEFSYIPNLFSYKFQGSIIFWLIINVILLLLLFREIRRDTKSNS